MRYSIIVLVLVAIGCDSGTQTTKLSPEETRAAKEIRDKIASERAARIAKEEADRLARDKPNRIKREARDAAAKTPSMATVKAQMDSAQLALGDPIANRVGMVLVPIPAGGFERSGQLVKITKPFYISAFEVTQQQYAEVMGVRPWHGKASVQEQPDNAATHLSWDDATKFCLKLSEQEDGEYGLPTEAQWEYACRGGTTSFYSFGDDLTKLEMHAWYSTESGEEYAHRIGQKLPNPWGLYDMHGNVYEWCQDWYGKYGSEKVLSDPDGPVPGEARVLRGGSFGNRPGWLRSSARHSSSPDAGTRDGGFRPVRTFR